MARDTKHRARAVRTTAVVFLAALWMGSALADEEVSFEFDADSARDSAWAYMPETYNAGSLITLEGNTQPDCADSALRISKEAFLQSDIQTGIEDAIEFEIEVAGTILDALGLGFAGDAAALSFHYFSADDGEDFADELAEWAAGKLGSAAVEGLPDGYGDDGMLTYAGGKAAEKLYDAVFRALPKGRYDVSIPDHPQCRYDQIFFSVQAGYGGSPTVRTIVQGDCNEAWPVNRPDTLGAFRVEADFPLIVSDIDENDDDNEIVLSMRGDPVVSVTALCR